MRVRIEQLSKQFGQTTVLREVSLTVEEHELFFLLGPSGCGKTTLLRLIAGFYEPDSGRIWFGDRDMSRVPPHRRNTGMVFQNYALWPHLTVAENVAYGLDVRAVKAKEKSSRVADALAIVQMEGYAERLPNQLSGGQQQRVALARALVIQPDVLLLDEPLSNLDAKLRLEMRAEIRRIHKQTRITTIYVTHDQKESLSLADRMAVMRAGLIEQIGLPRTVYRQPATRFVADFMGESHWLEATIEVCASNEMILATELGNLVVPSKEGFRTGQAAWVGFRPEAVQFGTSAVNAVSATVEETSYLGEIEQYYLRHASGAHFQAIELNPETARGPGEEVSLHIAPQNLMVFLREPQAKPT